MDLGHFVAWIANALVYRGFMHAGIWHGSVASSLHRATKRNLPARARTLAGAFEEKRIP
jgi:hypothetical protein